MRYFSFVLLLFACGCVQYIDKPLNPEQHSLKFKARSLNDDGFRNFMNQWLPGKKEQQWGLDDLTLAALYFQPDLQEGRCRYLRVLSEIGIEKEYPNPVLGVGPSFNTTTPASEISPWVVGISLDMPLPSRTKRELRIAIKQIQAEIEALTLKQQAWNSRDRVYGALLDIYLAKQEAEILKKRYDLVTEYVEIVEKEAEVGQKSEYEAFLARKERNQVQYDRIAAQRVERLARQRLAEAIGVMASELKNITLNFDGIINLDNNINREDLLAKGLLSRADVLAALEQYRQSQVELQYEIARQYPNLTIGPGYEFDQDEHKWGLSLGLELPVFNRHRAEIEVAQHKREELAAHFDAVQGEAIQRLDYVLSDYQEGKKQYGYAQELIKQEEETLAKLKQIRAVGQISRPAELLGELALNKAQQLKNEALGELLRSLRAVRYESQDVSRQKLWKEAVAHWLRDAGQ